MKSIKAVVFDLYGTLYDVHSVANRCSEKFPGRGMEISMLWRQKQLEYTWLRTLMGQYLPFEKATDDALRYVADYLKLDASEQDLQSLCEEYLRLQPFPEVDTALIDLRAQGVPLAILSNGSTLSINAVVGQSMLSHHFDHLISVDGVRVFKPHQGVYEMAERRMGVPRDETLFVSSNSWDASGARHFGYQVCWVNRLGNTFDRLGQSPHFMVKGLQELPELVAASAVVS